MNQNRLDRYTDYLSVTFGYARATGLSQMLDGQVSHDAISRFLSERDYTSKDLWKQVKRLVREVEADDGVLHQPLRYCDLKTRQEKRCSDITKNEQMRAMIDATIQNQA